MSPVCDGKRGTRGGRVGVGLFIAVATVLTATGPGSRVGAAPFTPQLEAALPVPPSPPSATAVAAPPLPAADADWLQVLNYYRALAGAQPVVEDPTLSAHDRAHAQYTLAIGELRHDEDIAHPLQSPDGLAAAKNSNGWGNVGPDTMTRVPIDAWASSIGHGLPMLRAEFRTTGFAMVSDAAAPNLHSTAWLDVYSAPQGLVVPAVRTMPTNQSVISAEATPIASEHVVATCPGLHVADQLPLLWVWLPSQPGAATVEVRRDGAVVPSCAFTGATYANADPTWGPYYKDLLSTTAVVGIALGQRYVPGAAYSVSLSAPRASGGAEMTAAWSYRIARGSMHPIAPVRLFDTRTTEPAGVVPISKKPIAGAPLTVTVAGVAGIPRAGAAAVSLNVTAVDSTAEGYLTVYPCGQRPLASSLNFAINQTVANAVVTPVSADGTVCFYASRPTELVVDVNAWFGAGSALNPVPPTRVFDTRADAPQGAVPVEKRRVGAGEVLRMTVAGAGGVPQTGAGSVALNVTAVGPAGPGFVTAYPCGERPNASNLNVVAGATIANAVLAPVSASGEICFFASVETDLLADVSGWLASESGFTPLSPIRLIDTRTTEPPGAISVDKHRYGGDDIVQITVAGPGGVLPAGVGAVSLNVTAIDPDGPGFVTVFPCGARPTASSLNHLAGQTVANAVISPLSPSGQVCVFDSQHADLVIDLNGWFVSAGM